MIVPVRYQCVAAIHATPPPQSVADRNRMLVRPVGTSTLAASGEPLNGFLGLEAGPPPQRRFRCYWKGEVDKEHPPLSSETEHPSSHFMMFSVHFVLFPDPASRGIIKFRCGTTEIRKRAKKSWLHSRSGSPGSATPRPPTTWPPAQRRSQPSNYLVGGCHFIFERLLNILNC